MATTSVRGADKEGRMSLGQHLIELRKRLFIAAIAVLLASVAGWFLSEYVLDFMRAPVEQVAHSAGRTAALNYANVTGAFDLKIQISLTVGVVISSPVWLYQVWAFIVPALVRREKVYALGFALAAFPLFLAGCAAGCFIVPHIVEVLTSFIAKQDTSIIDAKTYYDFVLKLVLAVGVAFVLPVFLVMLNFLGIVSAVAIIKGWRIAIILIALFTALVTPSADVISMFLLAIPMVFLYLAAAFVSWLHDRAAARRSAALDAELAGE